MSEERRRAELHRELLESTEPEGMVSRPHICVFSDALSVSMRDVLALVELGEVLKRAVERDGEVKDGLRARVKVLEEALRELAESDDYYVTSYVEIGGVRLDEWARRLLASAPAAEREDRV